MQYSDTHLLTPRLLSLGNDGGVGVSHHSDKHVDHHNWHDNHVENENELCQHIVLGAFEFFILHKMQLNKILKAKMVVKHINSSPNM